MRKKWNKKWDKNIYIPNKAIQNATIPQVNVLNNNANPSIGNMPNVNNINKKKNQIPLRMQS